MGHRHKFNTPHHFEPENDQRWNQAEQTFMPIARAGASDSNSLVRPLANTSIQGGHYPSHWNHDPSPNGYSSFVHNNELPVYQAQALRPSHDPFPSQPANIYFHTYPDNYPHYPSSSNLGGQSVPAHDGNFYDQTMGSSFRGPYKRKNPPVCERGSTSSCYDVGSSSNLHLSSDQWQEKHNTESHHAINEYLPSHRVRSLGIGEEGMLRNVRSRAGAELETNSARTHLSSNSLHYHPFSSQSNSTDFWGQSSNAPTRDHGLTSGSDSSFFNYGPNSVNAQNCHSSRSLENSGCHNDLTSNNRNPAPQNVTGNINQSGRVFRSGYGPRTAPTFRASSSSSNVHHGRMAVSAEGQQMVSGRYPSRDRRTFSTIRWRHVDRNRGNLDPSDRYRSFTEDANFRDRLTPEGVMLDYSSFYGSRTLFDQHRDMRLDVDNMSYEELLALGERIGTVNTGLSDGLISKCLTESIYCSSDLSQDEGMCVICLEEYKNMDDVGTLKACRHDFHVVCIRKWLSMKNLCPICKSPAIDDSKEK